VPSLCCDVVREDIHYFGRAVRRSCSVCQNCPQPRLKFFTLVQLLYLLDKVGQYVWGKTSNRKIFDSFEVVESFDWDQQAHRLIMNCSLHFWIQLGGQSFSTRNRLAMTSAETPNFGAMRVAM